MSKLIHYQLQPDDTPESRFYLMMKTVLLVFIIASIGLSIGCSQIRKLTYPPGFVYLEKKEIDSTMVLLSLYVRQMDEILITRNNINDSDNARIVEILSLINSSIDSLASGQAGTNHLVIDDHINDFKSDVYVALLAARAKPPNYYAAGNISGSCSACHRYR